MQKDKQGNQAINIMTNKTMTLAQAAKESWDVIIVGSGMGGGCSAYSLANKGKKVLLLEKGLAESISHEGVEVEKQTVEERLAGGRWPEQLTGVIDGRRSDFWAALGCGVGGSTLLYAAALQRLEIRDFDDQPHPDGGQIGWPFTYNELQPYYLQAEKIFRVKGSQDPLDQQSQYELLEPPEMCEADAHFFKHFEKIGLNPYRLHVGLDYHNPCKECGGRVCYKSCKKDAKNSCVDPALSTGNLFIAAESEVLKINANDTRVESVTVQQGEAVFELEASIVILSAGAYFSPVILQKSKNEYWPEGLANKSDQVGRNIMFHGGAHIAFFPPKSHLSREGANKTIVLRDFYLHKGQKLGEFQSTGLSTNFGVILYALRLMFDQSILGKWKLFRHFLRIPAYIASKLLGDATVFATLVEDFPYKNNRVIHDESACSGMRFEYHIRDELLSRVSAFTRLLKKRLKLRCLPLWVGAGLNYGHPCGTCKAGDDPEDNVLDKNCKAHGIDNLYVVDASFMPTSGATNPSLTIAANALRVAEVINTQLDELPPKK